MTRRRRTVIRAVRRTRGTPLVRLQHETPGFRALVDLLATLALAEAARRMGASAAPPPVNGA
jgi:hypothetical protein